MSCLLLERGVNLDTLEDICRELEVLIGVLMAVRLVLYMLQRTLSFIRRDLPRPPTHGDSSFQRPAGRFYLPARSIAVYPLH